MRYLVLLLALTGGCGGEDLDADGYPTPDDCDDTRIDVNPAAEEVPYDGVDNDCDARTRDDDLDRDTFAAEDDCDDEDPTSYPGAAEACDGVDNDCNGTADDNVGAFFFADSDGDGFGDPAETVQGCAAPDGYVDNDDDCDDDDGAAFPGADETCDGVDEDCDGQIDDDAVDAVELFIDYDDDGFGSDLYTILSCDADDADGYVENDDDCADTDAGANPDADEICDGVDNDCDGKTDENVLTDWYLDYDGDGFGDDDRSIEACEAPTDDYVSTGGDCDDTDGALTTDCG